MLGYLFQQRCKLLTVSVSIFDHYRRCSYFVLLSDNEYE
ncbi:unnamed protein product [Amoebophrya sp. A120]|nr:unnamed protein product [Amoebophrya sp. A120]|eukprot:GSA120T00009872001.1